MIKVSKGSSPLMLAQSDEEPFDLKKRVFNNPIKLILKTMNWCRYSSCSVNKFIT